MTEYKIICDCETDKTDYGYHIYYSNREKEWSISINSCCGGCVCATDIEYCPYCAKKISECDLIEV